MEKIRLYINTRIPDCQTWLEVSLLLALLYVQFSYAHMQRSQQIQEVLFCCSCIGAGFNSVVTDEKYLILAVFCRVRSHFDKGSKKNCTAVKVKRGK